MNVEGIKVGYFQIVLLLLLSINYAIVSMSHGLSMFHNYTPKFYCEATETQNKTYGCVSSMNFSKTNSTTELHIDTKVSSCPTGYRFEVKYGETSIITDWELICERKYLSNLGTTLYFIGVLIGAWISGFLIDRIGRLPVMAMCLYTQGTMAVTLYIVQDYPVFLVVRSLQGVFVQGLQSSTYTLLIELFPTKSRTFVAFFIQSAWAIGLAILAGLSYMIPDWRILQLAISVPTAATVLYIWIVPESPRWLLASGKLTEADIALEKIAKYNSCCSASLKESDETISTLQNTSVSENARPAKPERKSRTLNVDLKKVKVDEETLEESTNLLTNLDAVERNDQRISCLAISEDLKKRLSNAETQLKVLYVTDISKDEKIDLSSNKRDSKLVAKSKESQKSSNIDEIVELRTMEPVPVQEEEAVRKETKSIKKDVKDQKPEKKKNEGLMDLLRHKLFRKYSTIIIFQWFAASLTYYEITFLLPNLNGNRHLFFALEGLLEIVSYIFTYFILSKYGRRRPVSLYMFFVGLICIVLAAIILLPRQEAIWIGPVKVTLIEFGKALIVGSFFTLFLYTTEIFPTVVRGACIGFCAAFARIGSLIAPQVSLLGEYTSPAMPIILIGILCLISGIAVLSLPETSKEPLPDTIEEAKQLGKEKEGNKCESNKNERIVACEEPIERNILREKLFSEEWVDAGNGVIVNFSDNKNNID